MPTKLWSGQSIWPGSMLLVMIKRSPLKRSKKRLKPKSARRANQLDEYRRLKLQYLLDHTQCEVCQKAQATQVHHARARIGDKLNDVSGWMAVCYKCHETIHSHGKWARSMGYLI